METSSEQQQSAPTTEPLTTSPLINEISAALARAQAKVTGAAKDSANPFFKSRYADLASVWEAMRDAYTSEGIAVVQIPNGGGEVVKIEVYGEDEQPIGFVEGVQVRLTTLLVHSSGQWIGGTCTMTSKDRTPQAHGSCLTYLRRYALSAVGSVAPEDDDGNGASRAGRPAPPPPPRAASTPPPANDARPAGPAATPDQLNRILADLKALKWAVPHQRSWLQKHAGVQTVSPALGSAKAEELLELLRKHAQEQSEPGAAG